MPMYIFSLIKDTLQMKAGTRHRTAQRIAKQLDRVVIAISERKRVLTLYKGDIRYKLRTAEELMSKIILKE